MSGRAPSARLFVAVDPPEQVALELATWARLAARETRSGARAGQQPLRVLDPELLHVTVCFLGNRAVDEIPTLAEQLAACKRPPVQLSIGAPLWLPPRRPRALAVELHDEGGALAGIQTEVAARLEWAGRDAQPHEQAPPRSGARGGPRRFHPHITVARMRHDAGRRRRAGASVGDGCGERTLPPTPALSLAPAELVLYRSWLSPEGASYEALSAFALG
ncbi:MAG TPA: RNA 2',3'-cyclic phosphodiesterase [Solirubrobacteraceae bacterium]|jgi:2'-5' RNA ligase|nr:RNA 2',3'-cyclic phosphodiesterase [Solirubrobacteraceae bacterium]